MINPNLAWELVKVNAKKALTANIIYHSIVERRAYKIAIVADDKIIITRSSGGENDELSENIVVQAIQKINKQKGRIKRRSLIDPTVAQETTLVILHPNLSWDETGAYIIEVK
jgi:hypothetical protein